MKYFYHVYVGDESYHAQEPLTYSSESSFNLGSLVRVPLKRKEVTGFIISRTQNPSFATKPIVATLADMPLPHALRQLHRWMLAYYPAPSGITTSLFLPSLLRPAKPLLKLTPKTSHLPKMTSEQLQSLELIEPEGVHILHGDTGSGKTRVYIELALKAWNEDKSSLILTPEISLTPQLVNSFRAVFGESVIVYHSKLSNVQRQVAWAQMHKSTTPLVVIGPRSVLFSPLANIGLIVVDEEHEAAYKQEQAPHYHALRVAAKLGSLHKAPVVAGSATPSVENYYIAEQKQRPIIRMHKRHLNEQSIVVVDLTNKDEFSRSSILSNTLIKQIQSALDAEEQSLLFLNRRGTARTVLCNDCGWQSLCPDCDIPLTYHADEYKVRCHICGYKDFVPHSCPECGKTDISFSTVGTKAIESEVNKLFPHAIIQRFDTDNKADERFEQHYEAIHDGHVDIVIGTQLLVKGLDLPKLSVMGIIVADSSLYMPDYAAEERTFQLITQAIGRVGRGHRRGTTIIQTYQPNTPVIQGSAHEDWYAFYVKEIQEREQFLFPPFIHMLKLTVKRKSQKSAESNAQKLVEKLRMNTNIVIVGPSPAFHEKVAGTFRWQILIKSKNRSALLAVISELPSGWTYDIDPTHIL